MTDGTTYVEVKLGGGPPQFLTTEQWQALDADRQAAYTVVNAVLTAEQMRQRQTEMERNAATHGSYSDPVSTERADDADGRSIE